MAAAETFRISGRAGGSYVLAFLGNLLARSDEKLESICRSTGLAGQCERLRLRLEAVSRDGYGPDEVKLKAQSVRRMAERLGLKGGLVLAGHSKGAMMVIALAKELHTIGLGGLMRGLVIYGGIWDGREREGWWPFPTQSQWFSRQWQKRCDYPRAVAVPRVVVAVNRDDPFARDEHAKIRMAYKRAGSEVLALTGEGGHSPMDRMLMPEIFDFIEDQ